MKFLWTGTLASLAGALLCLAASMLIVSLQSPRVDIDRPWFDSLLDALRMPTTFFFAVCLLFKFAYQIAEDRRARDESDPG